METLLFLLLLCAYQGLAVAMPQPQQINIPAPDFKRFTTNSDANNITSHTKLTWSSVVNDDASDPVIGYKLKVWEIPAIKTIKHKYENGEVIEIVEKSYPEISSFVIPDGVPTVIVTSASETTATFSGMQDDVAYQFAVLAFTAKGEGPLSDPDRIRINPSD